LKILALADVAFAMPMQTKHRRLMDYPLENFEKHRQLFLKWVS
jgi:hypothetical protein